MSKPLPVSLPDFRNLGVILRCLFLVEGLAFLTLLANQPGLLEAMETFAEAGPLREPVLLAVMAIMSLASPYLARMPYRRGVILVLAMAFATGVAGHLMYGALLTVGLEGSALRTGLLAVLSAGAVLAYFNWRHRALSPALAEARLMALQARIRPHFLFNSLNTVLGLIRSEPKRAEAVLENLAELYRALLSEVGTLVSLGKEVELARAYAEIEKMRLGERLQVNWQCQDAALDALVPPLLLQPLLENAVYHGVEPSESGGKVDVTIFLKGDQVNMVVRNPCESAEQRQHGNRMALTNIRERLALHFDAEAEMSTFKAGGEFVVQIRVPYRRPAT